jgi:hypothetical protein
VEQNAFNQSTVVPLIFGTIVGTVMVASLFALIPRRPRTLPSLTLSQ